VEIHYKLDERTEAKCIRTQDKTYTTLHKRYEINALETHFIECYNFREGLTSENAAFLWRQQFSLQTQQDMLTSQGMKPQILRYDHVNRSTMGPCFSQF